MIELDEEIDLDASSLCDLNTDPTNDGTMMGTTMITNVSNNGLDHYTIVQDHRHKTSSCVWKYFGQLKKNGDLVDEKHVYCTKCFDDSKMKKYQKSTSTGNLIKHLKKAHNVTDQQSYRIKQENDRIVVTKEETFFDDETEADYYLENPSSSYVSLSSSGLANNGTPKIANSSSEADANEFLVHDINEILIHEIAKRPQIYDASLCTKNKAQIRRNLWTEIYEALNHFIPYDKLPKIWKNIRDRYQKIKRDMEKDGRTSKPRYRYYDMLRFLDDVDCGAVMDEKIDVPIDNFVSNFIFMEVEPQVENAPANGAGGDEAATQSQHQQAQQPKQQLLHQQQHATNVIQASSFVDDLEDEIDIDDDDDEDDDDDDDDDEDEEDDLDDDVEDVEALLGTIDDDDDEYDDHQRAQQQHRANNNHHHQHQHQHHHHQQQQQHQHHIDIVNGGDLTHLHQISGHRSMSIHDLSDGAREEIFGHEPKAKKIKLETLQSVSLGVTDVDLSPAPPVGGHRDLMTPDNIASLLVEQHQHELLCHQQQQQQHQQHHQHHHQQSIIRTPPSQSLPVTTWQLTPHQLTDTIDIHQQHQHLQPQPQQQHSGSSNSNTLDHLAVVSPSSSTSSLSAASSPLLADLPAPPPLLQLSQSHQRLTSVTLTISPSSGTSTCTAAGSTTGGAAITTTPLDVMQSSPLSGLPHDVSLTADILAAATATMLATTPSPVAQQQQRIASSEQLAADTAANCDPTTTTTTTSTASNSLLSTLLPHHLHHQHHQHQHHSAAVPPQAIHIAKSSGPCGPAVLTPAATPAAPVAPATATATAAPPVKVSEEYAIFGSYVAEVMKNMEKPKARLLQMKVMQLIAEFDCDEPPGNNAQPELL